MTVSSTNTRISQVKASAEQNYMQSIYMKNAATAAIKTLMAPLGEIPLAELKTGDLLGIIDEEVMDPDGIVEEPDMDIEDEAVGIIIDMLDEPDIGQVLDFEQPPVIPPIIAPTYRINPVSLLQTGNFFLKKNIKSNYLEDSGASNDSVISNGGVALGEDDVALSGNAAGNSHGEFSTTVRHQRGEDGTSDGDKGGEDIRGVHRGVETRAGHQLDLGAAHDGSARGRGERREGLHGEHAVARGARGNEG